MRQTNFNSNWLFSNTENSQRRRIDLPHDAMIEEERIPKIVAGETSAYFPGGFYTYEKCFDLNDEKVHYFIFDGIYQNAKIFINDQFVTQHFNGTTRFRVDGSQFLSINSENKIRVEVDNTRIPNARWYTGSGIYRDVTLYSGNETHILPNSVRIHTLSIAEKIIKVEFDVITPLSIEEIKTVFHIYDDQFKEYPSETIFGDTSKIENGYRLSYQVKIKDAKIWTPELPTLYSIVIDIEKMGEILDRSEESSFGLRILKWSYETGLELNNKSIKLRGACIHQDNGLLGVAEYKEAVERKIKLLKEAGYNAIRMSHQPPSKVFLTECDRQGMLVMVEFTDVWQIGKTEYDYSLYFEECWEDDMEDFIAACYNHPSNIMYSIGNEISDISYQIGHDTNNRLVTKLKSLDRTRPVTNCIHAMAGNSKPKQKPIPVSIGKREEIVNPKRSGKQSPLIGSKWMNMIATFLPKIFETVKAERLEQHLGDVYDTLDIIGINYGTHLSEGFKNLDTKRLLVHSETYPSMIGKTWPITEKSSHVIGDFMWTGWDYLGEVGIGTPSYGREPLRLNKPYPHISAGLGSINILGELEAQAFYSKAVFGQSSQPYIGVRPMVLEGKKMKVSKWRGTDVIPCWTWPGYEGKQAAIEVFANAATVELVQNEVSLGIAEVTDCIATFEVIYTPGELKAIAYDKDGQIIGESLLKTAGSKTVLSLYPEKESLTLGNNELLYLPIRLTDQDGIVKMNEKRDVRVSVEGVGELLALGNASRSPEYSYVRSNSCETFNGSLLAIVKTGKEVGEILIKVESKDLEPQILTVKVNKQN